MLARDVGCSLPEPWNWLPQQSCHGLEASTRSTPEQSIHTPFHAEVVQLGDPVPLQELRAAHGTMNGISDQNKFDHVVLFHYAHS